MGGGCSSDRPVSRKPGVINWCKVRPPLCNVLTLQGRTIPNNETFDLKKNSFVTSPVVNSGF